MKFGSVCSGIEAASVAWEPLGLTAEWVSEIEPFPSAVLAHRWPDVPNLGNMLSLPTAIAAGGVSAPDILVGGTPCQAFSVAGQRGSLEDERGALTLAFVEIANEIDRQREVPAIIVWENVPGVLNTKDNAFGCFLAGLAGEGEPLLPAGPRWTNAGCVFGPKRTVAWRVLDAQYFGLAQRRRRVFVVASARDGFDPCEVLFEREGVRRDTAPSREAGQDAAADVGPGFEVAGTLDARREGGGFPGSDGACSGHVVPILEAGARTGVSTTDSRAGMGVGQGGDPMYTLQAGKQHAVAVTGQITHALNTANNGKGSSEDGTGRGVPTIAHTVALRGRDGGATAELGGRVATALRASTGGGDKPHVVANLAVRRLTPVECERLQGFPDDYTLVPHRNKPAADGPRYKALGNSMAVPCVRWIGERIDKHLSTN